MKKSIIEISGSLNFYKGTMYRKYKKKDGNLSTYKSKYNKAMLRLTSYDLIKKMSKIDKSKRRIILSVIKDEGKYVVNIERCNNKDNGVFFSTYTKGQPTIQITCNKFIPKYLINKLKISNKKSFTIPVKVRVNTKEWKDMKPSDFLIDVEKDAKLLMDHSLHYGLKSYEIVKGRGYDLQLLSPNKNKFYIAISTYGGKSNKLRRKEKIKQKMLHDISKLLIFTYGKRNRIPVIITRPMETTKTWNYTTSSYIDFYKNRLNFRFITTNFKKGWEDQICKELLKLDKEIKNV